MKVRKSASKRYRFTRTGKIIRKQAYKAHILQKKRTKRKRQLRQCSNVFKGDARAIQFMLRASPTNAIRRFYPWE